MKSFTTGFPGEKIQEVNSNLKYLTGVALGVICLIIISGFIVIPLFGKIQNRILELMKLFFSIDMEVKLSIITRIKSFQNTYFRRNLYPDLKPNQLRGGQLTG